MKPQDIIACEKLRSQIDALYKELHPYALKKPHDPVNKFKLGIINVLIGSINTLIGHEYCPISGFEQFDENTMPTTSDVSLVIDQYVVALEAFRSRNIAYEEHDEAWFYILDDDIEDDDMLFVETDPPTIFR